MIIAANRAMNQSKFLVMTCNLLKAREKSLAQGENCFGFGSHWLKTGERFLSKALSAAIEIKSFSDVLVLLLNQPDRVI